MTEVVYRCDAYKVCTYPFQNSLMVFFFYSSGRIMAEHEDGTVIKQFMDLNNYKSILKELSEM